MHRRDRVHGWGVKYVRLPGRAGMERVGGLLADDGSAEIVRYVPSTPLLNWWRRDAKAPTQAGTAMAASYLIVRPVPPAPWVGRTRISHQPIGAKRVPRPSRDRKKRRITPGRRQEPLRRIKKKEWERLPGRPQTPPPLPVREDWGRLPGDVRTPPPPPVTED